MTGAIILVGAQVVGSVDPLIQVFREDNYSSIPSVGYAPASNPLCVGVRQQDGLVAVGITGAPYLKLLDPVTFDDTGIALVGHTTAVNDVRFSADGSLLASVGNSRFIVYDTSDWSVLVNVSASTGNGVAIASDNSRVAVVYTFSPYLRIYETASWTFVSPAVGTIDGASYDVVFSASNAEVVSAGNGASAARFSAVTAARLADFSPAPTGLGVASLAISADGATLAVKPPGAALCTYSMSTLNKIGDVSITGGIAPLVSPTMFSADGSLLFARQNDAANDRALIYAIPTGSLTATTFAIEAPGISLASRGADISPFAPAPPGFWTNFFKTVETI